MYVVGGCDDSYQNCNSKVEIYNSTNKAWVEGTVHTYVLIHILNRCESASYGAGFKIRQIFFGAERFSQKTVERSGALKRFFRKKLERSGAVERKFRKFSIFCVFFMIFSRIIAQKGSKCSQITPDILARCLCTFLENIKCRPVMYPKTYVERSGAVERSIKK
jgi:hypothetical protein